MNRLLLCLLPLFFYHPSGFAEDANSKTKLKSALIKLKEHLSKEESFSKNPLRSFEFQNFASRGYLYYYRALGDFLLSKYKKSSEKIVHLDQALNDLLSAQKSPYFDANSTSVLANTLLKEKIEIGLEVGDFGAMIDAIEKLPRSDQADNRYILYYGYALFKTSQTDALSHLAKRYLKTFKDHALTQEYLGTVPSWDELIDKIREDSFESKTKLSPQVALPTIPQEPYKLDSEITALWKKRDLKKAEKMSKSFLKYRWHPLYSKILFNLARIQEDAKRYTQAASTYEKFLKESDDTKLYEIAQFRVGWVLYLAKKEKKAKLLFEAYIKNYPEGRYASTCEYFLLQMTKSKGKNAVSKEELAEKYIDNYPLGFYSILLMDELNLKDEALLKMLSSENSLKALENQYNTFKADIGTLSRMRAYKELLDIGLKEEAVKTLKGIPFDERNELLTLYLAAQFHDLEDTHGEESNLVRVFSNFEQFRKYIPWKGLFPKYHMDTIKEQIDEQHSDLSPLLVLSIIRQESAFDPEARSPANAFGLMQLTPGTAKEAATSLNITDFSLLKESDNLKLGIRTMTALLKKYNNRLDYALSAYNAGETATQMWIDFRGHLKPIEFIESIPYQETRMYVKNILRNYAIYRVLYDKRPHTLISYNLIADLR